MEHAIWWVSQDDCERLGEDPAWPDAVPQYVRDEYRSRVGRAGRGRLWSADGMPTETTNGWPECPETKAAHDCGGIVMTIQDARTVAGLPGFLTTMDMRWLTPNAKVSLGAEALEEADHVSTSARPLG